MSNLKAVNIFSKNIISEGNKIVYKKQQKINLSFPGQKGKFSKTQQMSVIE